MTRKVLLIGWDAADWRMLRPLLDAGEMPALASLMARGVHGNLASIQPMLSPMLWTSIATGKRADKHGICGFLEPKPDNTGVQPVTSTSRTCKALWNIATQCGMRTNVINWFASHPAEPIAGAVVSDRFAALAGNMGADEAMPEGIVHPQELARPLSRLLVNPGELDAQALLPFVPRAAEIDQQSDDRLMKLATLIARTASTQAAATLVMQHEDWDLTCVYFDGIDQFGHVFMPYHPPAMSGVDARDAVLYGQVMTGCYRFHDMMLQAQLAAAGEDTTVILVSDHGFHHADHRPGTEGFEDPESWHRPFGIACMAGPGVRAAQPLYGASLLDVTPTILTLLGLPVGADMDGRPWLEVLDRPVRPERIISWERRPGDDGRHDEQQRDDPVTAAQVMAHLADLGYVEPPDADQQAAVERASRDLQVNLARALADSRRAERAVPIWESLVDQHPDQSAYRFELARCLLHVGRDEQALEQLALLDEAERSTTAVRLLVARIHMEAGRNDKALAELVPLSKASPDSAIVHCRLGQARLRSGDLSQAEAALKRAVELDSESPLIADARAELALKQNDAAAAIDHALVAVGLAHHFPRAHYHLGQALAMAGETSRAIQALETALALAPSYQAAQRMLLKLDPQRSPASLFS